MEAGLSCITSSRPARKTGAGNVSSVRCSYSRHEALGLIPCTLGKEAHLGVGGRSNRNSVHPGLYRKCRELTVKSAWPTWATLTQTKEMREMEKRKGRGEEEGREGKREEESFKNRRKLES